MIVLNMEPNIPPVLWKIFCRDYPECSIAIDGFVCDSPKVNHKKRQINFNHHERVSRLETRATCAQILVSIRQGLFDYFKTEKSLPINVYANDCDQDVCVSWFLLNNKNLVQNTINPIINRLVYMEDMLDATAGAYPFPSDLKTLEHLSWIFHPYTLFRQSGNLFKRNKEEFENVLFAVEQRILSHVMGNSQTLELDTRYEKVGGGKNWALVKEIGFNARTAMFSDGIKAFVSYKEIGNGKYSYVLGKMSDYIDFDILGIINRLNDIEICENDRWGGNSIIAGSPRINGSRINPENMIQIIEEGNF